MLSFALPAAALMKNDYNMAASSGNGLLANRPKPSALRFIRAAVAEFCLMKTRGARCCHRRYGRFAKVEKRRLDAGMELLAKYTLLGEGVRALCQSSN